MGEIGLKLPYSWGSTSENSRGKKVNLTSYASDFTSWWKFERVRGTNVELAKDSQCQAELCLQALLLMEQYKVVKIMIWLVKSYDFTSQCRLSYSWGDATILFNSFTHI
jgi:hypothetical protein